MATLVLSAVGTAIGGPIGGAVGALIGRSVDARIFRPATRAVVTGHSTRSLSASGRHAWRGLCGQP